MKRLFVLVERQDGSTYEQEIEWRDNESVATALTRFKKVLGRGYHICDWYIA